MRLFTTLPPHVLRPLLWGGLLLLPATAAAQGDCFPPKDSHEAMVFGIFSVPLAFGASGAPVVRAPWSVTAELEGAYIPNVDSVTSTPTVCRPGKGSENTDFALALPRPRVVLGLPAGFWFEASWVPPVRLNGAKANLVGLALGRVFRLGSRGMVLGLRAHATAGSIHAPITCDDKALQDPTSECFGGTRSDDRYKPNIFGLEGTLGWSLGGGRFRPFMGGGYNLLHPRFQVHFRNQAGQLDMRKVTVDLNRGVLFGGATWSPSGSWSFTGEIYSAPTDAVTGRAVVSLRL